MGLIKTAAKVAVASSVHGRVQRRQRQRWADQDLQAAPAVAPAPMPTSGAPDLQTQLALVAQLNELRQAGALTDTEFEVKKAQILGL